MGVPVVLLGESLVDAVIEVLVVGEDNVATDIVQLENGGSPGQRLFDLAERERRSRRGEGSKHTKPSGVTSVEARPPGISLESMINQEGPSYSIGSAGLVVALTPPSTPYFFFLGEGERLHRRVHDRKDLRSG